MKRRRNKHVSTSKPSTTRHADLDARALVLLVAYVAGEAEAVLGDILHAQDGFAEHGVAKLQLGDKRGANHVRPAAIGRLSGVGQRVKRKMSIA
jgi:hypothetical protein